MIARESFEALYLGGNKQAMRRNEHGVYVLPSIQDAWAGWSAANDRIRALEGEEAAEREISDKLERALQYASQIIGHPDDAGSQFIRATLAEVAAIRAREQKTEGS